MNPCLTKTVSMHQDNKNQLSFNLSVLEQQTMFTWWSSPAHSCWRDQEPETWSCPEQEVVSPPCTARWSPTGGEQEQERSWQFNPSRQIFTATLNNTSCPSVEIIRKASGLNYRSSFLLIKSVNKENKCSS